MRSLPLLSSQIRRSAKDWGDSLDTREGSGRMIGLACCRCLLKGIRHDNLKFWKDLRPRNVKVPEKWSSRKDHPTGSSLGINFVLKIACVVCVVANHESSFSLSSPHIRIMAGQDWMGWDNSSDAEEANSTMIGLACCHLLKGLRPRKIEFHSLWLI